MKLKKKVVLVLGLMSVVALLMGGCGDTSESEAENEKSYSIALKGEYSETIPENPVPMASGVEFSEDE